MANSLATVGGTLALLVGVFVGGKIAGAVGSTPVVVIAGVGWLAAAAIATRIRSDLAPMAIRGPAAAPAERGPSRGRGDGRRRAHAGANAAGDRSDHVDHARPGRAGRHPHARARRVPRRLRRGGRLLLERRGSRRDRRPGGDRQHRRARGSLLEGADRGLGVRDRWDGAGPDRRLPPRLDDPGGELRRRAHVRLEEDPGGHDGPGGAAGRLPRARVLGLRRLLHVRPDRRGRRRDRARSAARHAGIGDPHRDAVPGVGAGAPALGRRRPRHPPGVRRRRAGRGVAPRVALGRGGGAGRGRAQLARGARRRAPPMLPARRSRTERSWTSAGSSPTGTGRSTGSARTSRPANPRRRQAARRRRRRPGAPDRRPRPRCPRAGRSASRAPGRRRRPRSRTRP